MLQLTPLRLLLLPDAQDPLPTCPRPPLHTLLFTGAQAGVRPRALLFTPFCSQVYKLACLFTPFYAQVHKLTFGLERASSHPSIHRCTS